MKNILITCILIFAIIYYLSFSDTTDNKIVNKIVKDDKTEKVEKVDKVVNDYSIANNPNTVLSTRNAVSLSNIQSVLTSITNPLKTATPILSESPVKTEPVKSETPIKTEPVKSELKIIGNPYDDFNRGDNIWEVKETGFSDIFNYSDKGGDEINKITDIFTNKDIVDYIIGSKLEKNIDYNDNIYSLLGLAENKSYRQYYFIYESKVNSSRTNTLINEELKYNNYQIYEYILVKYDANTPQVVHYIGPRNKINIDDIVYLSLGSFELGPLIIKPINI
jgi:hypothetical protein